MVGSIRGIIGVMHQLTNKNLVTKTAQCSECGPTRLVRINQGGVCPKGHAETNSRHYYNSDGQIIKLSGRERIELIESFGPNCNICGTELGESPQLDHCHDTGAWRGVLCRSCNLGLGMFKDDPQRLLNAIMYLSSTLAANQQNKVK